MKNNELTDQACAGALQESPLDPKSQLLADFILALTETRDAIRLEPAVRAIERYRAAVLAEFATRRESHHATFNGGWHHSDDGMKAFHHGMDTVFNTLEAEAKGERRQA